MAVTRREDRVILQDWEDAGLPCSTGSPVLGQPGRQEQMGCLLQSSISSGAPAGQNTGPHLPRNTG